MKKRYRIELTTDERDTLEHLIAAGTAPARKLHHARILLKADEGTARPGWPDHRIADAVEVSQSTVSRVRKQYMEEGLEAALDRRRPQRTYPVRMMGEEEARLIALACSAPPTGHARWSLRLLADKVVELGIVDEVSYRTVGRVLKKTISSRT